MQEVTINENSSERGRRIPIAENGWRGDVPVKFLAAGQQFVRASCIPFDSKRHPQVSNGESGTSPRIDV